MAEIGRAAVTSDFELSQYESLTWCIYWQVARQVLGMTVRAGARTVSAASAETMNPYKRGYFMKKLSTIAALAIASLVAANVYAADQKGMSGMQGMEGKKK